MSLEQRKEHLKKKKACLICLKPGHYAKICKAFIQCCVCKKRHSVALCPGQVNSSEKQTTIKEIVPASHTIANFSSQNVSVTLLQTIMVKIINNGKEVIVRALIDNGSQRSYLKKDVARQLDLNAIDVDENNMSDIGLLIGADYSGFLMTNIVTQIKESLVAIKTKLGWVLQGKVNNINSKLTNTLFCSSDVLNFWSLELLGIKNPLESKSKLLAEAEAVMSFEEGVTVNEHGKYEVSLPLKVGYEELLSNRSIVEKRLSTNTKSLMSSGKFLEYHSVISCWKEEGIIEEVMEDKLGQTVHYLPHRGVVKDASLTTKLRPVFDASDCDKNGRSLNSYLNKGLNFLDKIPHLLMGFRKGTVGISADIAKAFLQISVKRADRNLLRICGGEMNYKKRRKKKLI
ncbi:uncharacterized protein LOC113513551 [Galleria mellonella]|uniref:Uncharacterized protein LOC113513551 n=1 Tax=Galleria mellonella TaxID=7137 RepID=A0ABM3MVW2_GALME|nr:uncharacterized protein LOC113513551 [Galleria mellonella]